MQLIQISAARLVTRTQKNEHIRSFAHYIGSLLSSVLYTKFWFLHSKDCIDYPPPISPTWLLSIHLTALVVAPEKRVLHWESPLYSLFGGWISMEDCGCPALTERTPPSYLWCGDAHSFQVPAKNISLVRLMVTHNALTTLEVIQMAPFTGASSWRNVLYHIIPIILILLLLGYCFNIFLVFIFACMFILFYYHVYIYQRFVKRVSFM